MQRKQNSRIYKHGTSNEEKQNKKDNDDLIDDVCQFTGSTSDAVRKSVEMAVNDPFSLMDVMISIMEFGGDDPETAKRLLDMAELRLKTLVKQHEIYGTRAPHDLVPEEQSLCRAFSPREVLRMWLFRRENVIVTPIASIYESMSDMITDICDENKWGRAKGEEFIQREYANHYQFIDSIGLIVYELDA